ncbi:MAG: muconolactone Delta-isomerase family protein [Rhizomicrobium sp.]
MLFHVAMTVRIPPSADRAEVEALGAREHERAAALQRRGKWLHLWRVVGEFSNISVFAVDGPEEMHAILESLPLRPYMEVAVTALCRHPGALNDPHDAAPA